jgi:hypothetical protein
MLPSLLSTSSCRWRLAKDPGEAEAGCLDVARALMLLLLALSLSFALACVPGQIEHRSIVGHNGHSGAENVEVSSKLKGDAGHVKTPVSEDWSLMERRDRADERPDERADTDSVVASYHIAETLKTPCTQTRMRDEQTCMTGALVSERQSNPCLPL